MPSIQNQLSLMLSRNMEAYLEFSVGLRNSRENSKEANTSSEQRRDSIRSPRKQHPAKQPGNDRRSSPNNVPGSTASNDPSTDAPGKSTTNIPAGDVRDLFISEVVEGKTFADLGGLGTGRNEKLTSANKYGASSLTMIDVVPQGHGLWEMLSDRMQEARVEEYSAITDDILRLTERDNPLSFQVVHCTGVLYHMPEPMSLLKALYGVTEETLILGSAIAPAKISSSVGSIEMPESGALFVPALKGKEKAICEEYWKKFAGEQALGLTTTIEKWSVEDFAPWWYLPTSQTMESLCEAAGFEVIKGEHYWGGNAYVVMLSKR